MASFAQLPLEIGQLGFSRSEDVMLAGILIGVFTFFVLFVLISVSYKSKRKQRKWDEEGKVDPGDLEEVYVEKPEEEAPAAPVKEILEPDKAKMLDDQVVDKIKAGEVPAAVDAESKKFLAWMEKRRKTLRGKIKKLEEKQFTLGLSKMEETQKRAYVQENAILQEELLKNGAFLKKLKGSAEWAVKQAKKGTPSKEIKEKLVKKGYSKREIAIIRRVFKSKKGKRQVLPKGAKLPAGRAGSSL